MSLSFELPLPPSANALTYNTKFGRRKTAKYSAWIEEAGYALNRQRGAWKCTGPWSLEIMAVKPNNRRRDIDNLIKATADLLVRHGVVSDDSEMRSVSARWVPADQQKVACRVFVFSHNDGEF